MKVIKNWGEVAQPQLSDNKLVYYLVEDLLRKDTKADVASASRLVEISKLLKKLAYISGSDTTGKFLKAFEFIGNNGTKYVADEKSDINKYFQDILGSDQLTEVLQFLQVLESISEGSNEDLQITRSSMYQTVSLGSKTWKLQIHKSYFRTEIWSNFETQIAKELASSGRSFDIEEGQPQKVVFYQKDEKHEVLVSLDFSSMKLADFEGLVAELVQRSFEELGEDMQEKVLDQLKKDHQFKFKFKDVYFDDLWGAGVTPNDVMKVIKYWGEVAQPQLSDNKLVYYLVEDLLRKDTKADVASASRLVEISKLLKKLAYISGSDTTGKFLKAFEFIGNNGTKYVADEKSDINKYFQDILGSDQLTEVLQFLQVLESISEGSNEDLQITRSSMYQTVSLGSKTWKLQIHKSYFRTEIWSNFETQIAKELASSGRSFDIEEGQPQKVVFYQKDEKHEVLVSLDFSSMKLADFEGLVAELVQRSFEELGEDMQEKVLDQLKKDHQFKFKFKDVYFDDLWGAGVTPNDVMKVIKYWGEVAQPQLSDNKLVYYLVEDLLRKDTKADVASASRLVEISKLLKKLAYISGSDTTGKFLKAFEFIGNNGTKYVADEKSDINKYFQDILGSDQLTEVLQFLQVLESISEGSNEDLQITRSSMYQTVSLGSKTWKLQIHKSYFRTEIWSNFETQIAKELASSGRSFDIEEGQPQKVVFYQKDEKHEVLVSLDFSSMKLADFEGLVAELVQRSFEELGEDMQEKVLDQLKKDHQFKFKFKDVYFDDLWGAGVTPNDVMKVIKYANAQKKAANKNIAEGEAANRDSIDSTSPKTGKRL
jgi:Na+-translocating ferredoxin:NAD+ oxidoreductase RnfG subunit